MGAGRKTFSYDCDTRNETNYRFEQQQKNLGNQLGGVIFMCNNSTWHMCMEQQMFGLPQAHWCYVQYVRSGMPLFLYNFQSKQLHGIFKAASDGEWELDPTGWTDGSKRTPYPCQVRIELYLECPPLPLDTFKPLIRENMLGNTEKFQQELTKKQAAELCALFRSRLEGGQRTRPASAALNGGLASSSAQPAARAAAVPPQQQQQPAAAAAPRAAAPAAATAPAAAAAAAVASAAPAATKPALERLGDELVALKGTLRPMIATLAAAKSDAETRVAGTLQGHLHRFDDLFMQAQKERAQAVAQVQKLEALQQENASLRQQLGLGAPAAAAAAAPTLKSDEVYLMGGVEDRGEGGDDNSWLSTVLVYSPRSYSWRQGPDMKVKRGYGSSAVLGHHLYVMGGGNSTEWLGDCMRLDLHTGRWEQAPSMASVRGCAGSATLGGRLYVMGGGTADNQFDTLEIFNPEINAWMPGPKLRNRRFSTAAGVVDGCVYVTGGYDGSYLKSAERLDPREGKWQLIPDMRQARGAHACTAGPNSLLYVVGGYDVNQPDSSFMPTVEAFDPRLNAWVPKASMQQARAYGAAAFAEGALWVIGGMQADGYQYNRSFERYDAATDSWMSVPLPPNLPTSRAFLTASVVQPF
ncbi:ring canal kelch-like protein isoform X2 isoform A [Chlorella sorokiniana]|uniref:Ring canal kelch-like protein isoform X2 isoform A n=1 Tax=Chlorella sorokiniana TaxID=3076 RepID=A0A2P6TL73_CHLSO|nr:ring canal kelch-like protein isoform X2 isoform A [Chlorella sorokiniana]|eukprot:PRW44996.1 ring canal kelch-like protein isoform X2 isoform A [Chlorella sorokiniana]